MTEVWETYSLYLRFHRSPVMIQVSQTAVREILRLSSHHSCDKTNLRFRLSIFPQGCLSWSYALSFTQEIQPEDQELGLGDGLHLVVNGAELPLLQDVTIDYSEDLMGGGFRFNNPNATQVCSCGLSFAIGEQAGTTKQTLPS